MDKEVEDILSGDSDSEDDGEGGVAGGSEVEGGSESEDSLTGVSRGHKRKLETIQEEDSQLDTPGTKFKNGEEVPSDFDVDDASDDSGDDGDDDDPGDWSLMGAALEKELE